MVADRGIQIWYGFVKLIKFILQKPQSSRLKDNKLFDNLVLHNKVQLHLFKDIAFILNDSLVTFQTDDAIPQHGYCTNKEKLDTPFYFQNYHEESEHSKFSYQSINLTNHCCC